MSRAGWVVRRMTYSLGQARWGGPHGSTRRVLFRVDEVLSTSIGLPEVFSTGGVFRQGEWSLIPAGPLETGGLRSQSPLERGFRHAGVSAPAWSRWARVFLVPTRPPLGTGGCAPRPPSSLTSGGLSRLAACPDKAGGLWSPPALLETGVTAPLQKVPLSGFPLWLSRGLTSFYVETGRLEAPIQVDRGRARGYNGVQATVGACSRG